MRNVNLQARPMEQGYFDVIGYDPVLAGAQLGIHEAVVALLHELAVPALVAGDVVGGVALPANHALTLHSNLFVEHVELSGLTDLEPVVVSVVPDGTVATFGSSPAQGENTGVVRVSVRGLGDALAAAAAWRIHGLFSRRLSFERSVRIGCDDPDGQQKTDLVVRDARPIDEPAVAERADDRVHVTFRIMLTYARK